jgi:hypothetical protein
MALNLLPPDAAEEARTALNAAEELLRRLPADDFTQQVLKIDQQRPEPPKRSGGRRQK